MPEWGVILDQIEIEKFISQLRKENEMTSSIQGKQQ